MFKLEEVISKHMRALVIDDEELARKRILNLLQDVPAIEVIGECSNGQTAIKKINAENPDLVFLDINMKDMNGFEVLQKVEIKPKPVVIFITAYDTYAIRAFDVEAFDFLLKPFKDQRFFRTIDRVLKTTESETDARFEQRIKELLKVFSAESPAEKLVNKIPVKQGNKTVLLDPKNILYIIASGYYAEIYTGMGKYVLRESLSNLEEQLDHNFFRIHRSTIVNINQVKEIVHSEYSEIDARMYDDKLLHISKSNKKEFLEKFGI